MSKSNALVAKIFEGLDVVLKPDTSTHRLRMDIQSETSNAIYVVSQRMKKDGGTQFECGCPGWTMSRHKTHDGLCKHLRAMMPALEAAAALLDGASPRKVGVIPAAADKKAPKFLGAAKKDPFTVKRESAKVKKSDDPLQALVGQEIVEVKGDKGGLELRLADGTVIEVVSRYEGGIKIEITAEEVVPAQKKKVKHTID